MTGSEHVCAYCGVPRSEIGTRPQFEDHLVEEHTMEIVEWLLSDVSRTFRRTMNVHSPVHDPHWEFIENVE